MNLHVACQTNNSLNVDVNGLIITIYSREVIFTLIPCSCILKRVKCVICFFIVEYFVSYHLLFQIIKYTIIYFLPFILTYLEIKIIFDKFITRLLNFVVLVKYSNFRSEAHVQQCDFRVQMN